MNSLWEDCYMKSPTINDKLQAYVCMVPSFHLIKINKVTNLVQTLKVTVFMTCMNVWYNATRPTSRFKMQATRSKDRKHFICLAMISQQKQYCVLFSLYFCLLIKFIHNYRLACMFSIKFLWITMTFTSFSIQWLQLLCLHSKNS